MKVKVIKAFAAFIDGKPQTYRPGAIIDINSKKVDWLQAGLVEKVTTKKGGK